MKITFNLEKIIKHTGKKSAHVHVGVTSPSLPRRCARAAHL